jgi:DNA (cytosine-5)-methyltransferase 1
MNGIETGARSALYWHWIRVLDEMPEESRPPILCAENVVGFLVADSGSQFKLAYDALKERGYRAGAFVIDAKYFTPQSRPRSFLVAVKKGIDISGLSWRGPQDRIHPKAAIQAYLSGYDPEWIWWQLPSLPKKQLSFEEICEWDAPSTPQAKPNIFSQCSLKRTGPKSICSSNRENRPREPVQENS